MKTTQKRIRCVLLILTALFLLHTFVSCGGLPASPIEEKETRDKITYVEPPEFEPVETLKPFEYEGNPMLPEYVGNTPTPEKETDKPAATTVRYAASRESNKYHRLRCHYVDNILPENLVYYTSEDAARRAGKSPCSVCRP